MKKILLILAISSFCEAENCIFYAERQAIELPSMQETLDAMELREKCVIAQCLAYIKHCGKEEGIKLSRILLDLEIQNNPHHTVFSIKRYLNELGYNV